MAQRWHPACVLPALTALLLTLGSGPEPEAPAISPTEAGGAEATATAKSEYSAPPRIDGFYLGGAIHTAATVARVENYDTDPFWGGGGNVNVGAAVLPWMTIGFEGRGANYFNSRGQRMFQGGLIAEAGFYPLRRHPFSIHAGLGFGLGYVEDDSVIEEEVRSGLGFPQFMGLARYEFFPGARKRRPYRAGGFAIGPEIGWRGFTPSKRGRPMSNSFFVSVWFAYYWGR